MPTTRFSALSVDRVKLIVYTLSGLASGLAAWVLVSRVTTTRMDMGSGYELRAIAAAVMGGAALSGGRGSFYGALVGAVTLTVIQNVINILNLDTNWEDVIVGAIILFAVLIDRGALALAGRKSRE